MLCMDHITAKRNVGFRGAMLTTVRLGTLCVVQNTRYNLVCLAKIIWKSRYAYMCINLPISPSIHLSSCIHSHRNTYPCAAEFSPWVLAFKIWSQNLNIGRPRGGSPICLSQVWLQTELDDMKSYYQLIKKITIFRVKKNIAKL